MSLTKLDMDSAEMFLKMAAKEIKKKNYKLIKYKKVDGKIYSIYDLLISIGITNEKDIWNHILTLTKEDCVDVSIDHDISRDTNTEMYEFKKYINNKLVYIKLTIRNKLICMSFHEDNYRSIRGDKNE